MPKETAANLIYFFPAFIAPIEIHTAPMINPIIGNSTDKTSKPTDASSFAFLTLLFSFPIGTPVDLPQ